MLSRLRAIRGTRLALAATATRGSRPTRHAQRLYTGHTDWEAVVLIYEGLIHMAPTIGAPVSRAAAIAQARGAAAGWSELEAIPAEAVTTYQPYWAVAADLLKRLRRSSEAAAAYDRAIGLCEDPAMREFLRR